MSDIFFLMNSAALISLIKEKQILYMNKGQEIEREQREIITQFKASEQKTNTNRFGEI